MDDERFMRRAIEVAREGIGHGQSPFGALVVKNGQIVAEAFNTVRADLDPSAHAETNGIRRAARHLGITNLAGCTLYSTCEPCPMCLAAAHWANLDRVVFGSTMGDAERAGFAQLRIPATTVVQLGGSDLQVSDLVLPLECATLFDEWERRNAAEGKIGGRQ